MKKVNPKRGKIEYELKQEMDWHDVDSVEELYELFKAQAAAIQQSEIDQITKEIESGKNPNRKDIAYLLRNNKDAQIPQAMREYIAKLLLNEKLAGKGSQRNSRVLPNGQGLAKFSSKPVLDLKLKIEEMFGYVHAYEALQAIRINKDEAFELIARDRLLKLCTNFSKLKNIPDGANKDEYIQKILGPIDKALEALNEFDVENFYNEERKLVNEISHIVHPRQK